MAFAGMLPYLGASLGTTALGSWINSQFGANPGEQMRRYMQQIGALTGAGNVGNLQRQFLGQMSPQISQQLGAAGSAANALGNTYAREAGSLGAGSGIGAAGKGLAAANYGGNVSNIMGNASQQALENAWRSIQSTIQGSMWLPTSRPTTGADIFGAGLGSIGQSILQRMPWGPQPNTQQQTGNLNYTFPSQFGPGQQNTNSVMFQPQLYGGGNTNQFMNPGYSPFQPGYQQFSPYEMFWLQRLFGQQPMLGQGVMQ